MAAAGSPAAFRSDSQVSLPYTVYYGLKRGGTDAIEAASVFCHSPTDRQEGEINLRIRCRLRGGGGMATAETVDEIRGGKRAIGGFKDVARGCDTAFPTFIEKKPAEAECIVAARQQHSFSFCRANGSKHGRSSSDSTGRCPQNGDAREIAVSTMAHAVSFIVEGWLVDVEVLSSRDVARPVKSMQIGRKRNSSKKKI
jgi:hypothetical protein